MRDRALFEAEIALLAPGGGEREVGIGADVAGSATFYLPIALNKTVPKKVGAFVPTAARRAGTVDVIVYFHGHIIEACDTSTKAFQAQGMEYYWNTPLFRCLRRDLEASGRAAVLIAPTMLPFVGGRGNGAAGYGSLHLDGKLDSLVRQSLQAVQQRGGIAALAELGNVVLAGHSAGGQPMQAILDAKNDLKSKIRAAWGFECLYFGTAIWRQWLRGDSGVTFRHFRRKGWKSALIEKALLPLANYKDTTGASSHCKAVDEYWSKALNSLPITAGSSAGNGIRKEYEAPTRAKSSSPFKLTTIDLHASPTKLAQTGSPKAYAKDKTTKFVRIQQAPATFLPTVLTRAQELARKAGKSDLSAILDPTVWFTQFTRTTFLGRPLKSGDYLHVELAKTLKTIETDLMSTVGGSAQEVGDELLHHSTEGISGSRGKSSTAAYSFHMFGLAVDVNYLGNPFIEKGDIGTLNGVLRNASALLRSEMLAYKRPKSVDDAYNSVQRLDELVEQYFGLLDDPDELRAQVLAAMKTPWAGKSEKDARKKIATDLQDLSAALARNEYDKKTKTNPKQEHFKTHGLMDFDKRLVLAMVGAGLHWGALYGDIMHFDMRLLGVGRYIETARLEHLAKAESQMRKRVSAKEYGYFPFED